MKKAKVDHTIMMKLTCHKSPSMFNRYNTVNQEDTIDVMKRLNLFLSEQRSSESSDNRKTGTPDKKIQGSKEPSNLLKSLVPGPDLNRHGVEAPRDFKSITS
jgi:hypothetical protein